ncbi:3D domain-containing protein [Clostridium vincentii]|uniref:Cell wall-binding protein YocH n=1 Tax=Clostridium vincentii TaxID=52704 RepID=A0A2T0BJ71_9CLOT|nr:3D domain-containing protein [Clostridium vincentii]PRR83946.1 Cell wall-binding protein YocH precursor [Clostridium vincentii]
MKKTCFVILAFVILLLNITPTVKAANSLNDNKITFNQISDNLKELDSELAQVNKEIESLKTQVSYNEGTISNTEEEIKQTEENITSLQIEIDKSKAILNKRLREMYKSDAYSGINYLDFLFESDSLNDFFSKMQACNILITQDNKLINAIKDKVSELDESKILINEKKERLVALNEATKNKLKEVQDKESSIVEIKNKMAAEKISISALIEENELNLINYSLSVAKSSDSSSNELNQAIKSLGDIIPQLSTPSVIAKANEAIIKGKENLVIIGNSAKNNIPDAVVPDNNISGDNSYKETYSMEATAYYGGYITKLGLTPVRNPDGLSTVAVDPNVIPLGSKLFVEGYGYAIASDTGSAIIGKKIDLYMNSTAECISFGRRSMTVHLIAYEGQW